MELAPSIGVYTDGAAGNELPALALAAALSSEPPQLARLRAPWPQSWWLPRGLPLRPQQWQPSLQTAEWPDIAIGAGRMGAAALLTVKRASDGRTRTLQILDPRIKPACFDLVIAPAHDRLVADNVIVIDGSLHAINDAWLARERLMHARLGCLPSPRTVVLIGGPRRGITIGTDNFDQLAKTLQGWFQFDGGSLMLIGSRRTPARWKTQLRRALPEAALSWFGAEDGDNPYRGALAWGERFVVSADSVNMLSETLGTGCPVYSLCDGVPDGKLGVFHSALRQSGRLRTLSAQPSRWNYAPLRELERVTPIIRASLGLANRL